MLNWRRLKNVALAATVVSTAFASGAALAKDDAASINADDFKFPIVLCRFKQAVLKNSGGILKVVVDRDWGPEYAFPVGNVHAGGTRADNGQTTRAIDGDFSGNYEIQGSPYRLRLEGSIEQGLDLAGNHQLRFRTVLEKKLDRPDSSGKLWQEVGNSSNSVVARTQTDGTVWENVYPYTFNSTEMQRYMVGGKLKQDLVIAGIRDGFLDKGSVFKVGPACGFLDGRTAKSVASAEDRIKYHAIFDHIPDMPNSASALAASAPVESKKILSLKLPEPAASSAPSDARDQRDEREQQEQQQAIAGAQAPAEMSPELQTQLAQQNQLADQAAAAYNLQQQQAQNGQTVVDQTVDEGRDPASSQMPQANTIGQTAQNLQALQSPEQVQQHMNMLEQQRAALVQQQSLIDQQQQFLAQKQQDLAVAGADPGAEAQGAQIQPIQSSQAASMGQSF